MSNIDDKKLNDFLNRWVTKIYPSKGEFLKAIKSKKLVIYLGIDPTAPDLHLGHSTNLIVLKKLQEMGQKVILLIGDFTAKIGDPTGKSEARNALTDKEVKLNYKTYKKQAGKILKFTGLNPVKVMFNSKWLSKMNMADVARLFANFTHGKTIKREMFQERIKNNQEIYLHEFLYPILQGYDSVAMDVDAEVGGTDQMFNMMVGRKLVKKYKNKEKFVITTPLLENPKTGKKLMSKSEGGYISLQYLPNEMFGKIMALPDEAIIPVFKYCTDLSNEEIDKIEGDLKENKVNPRDLKVELGKELVKMYHSLEDAENAAKEFEKIFKEDHVPQDISEFEISGKINILDLLVKTKIAFSKSEARRLIEQKGVKIDDEIQTDWQKDIETKKGMVIQAGKRRFAKVK